VNLGVGSNSGLELLYVGTVDKRDFDVEPLFEIMSDELVRAAVQLRLHNLLVHTHTDDIVTAPSLYTTAQMLHVKLLGKNVLNVLKR